MSSLFPGALINNSSVTNVTSTVTSYTWTINNFSSIYKKIKLISPSWTSSTRTYGVITWNLELYPLGNDKSVGSNVSLCLLAKCGVDVEVEFTLAIIFDNRKENVRTSVKTLGPNGTARMTYHNFLHRDDPRVSVLLQSHLTIYCEVKVLDHIANSPIQTNSAEVPVCSLSQDWKVLFESSKFSDVTLSVDGQLFQAHKVVLAARSSVFSAMFDHEMTENIDNCVDITDAKPEVIREVLRYIYTGKTGNIDGMAGELLAAADKYALDRLKSMCEQVLSRNLSVKNVVPTLILADFHSGGLLKAQAIDYIIDHVRELVDTDGFKSLTTTHPHLMLKVLSVKCNI